MVVACGPEGSQSTDTDTETDTDGSDSSGMVMTEGGTMPATTAGPTTAGTTAMPTTAMPTTAVPTTETGPDTGDTEDCPPGTEGCPCDIGSECNDDLVCVDGVCEAATPCEDTADEPNDDGDSATMLDAAACGGDAGMGSGVIADVDIDFYRFAEAPLGICFGVEASARVDADEDLEVCVFLDCGNMPGTVTCGDNQTGDLDGKPGCCATNEVRLESHDCGISITPPNYIFSVGPGVAGQCTAYDYEYRIN